MRALIDTNLLINNLLSPAPTTSATGVLFQAALRGSFTLLLTVGVMEELDRKLRDDPGLAKRLPRADADDLIAILSIVAEIVPLQPEPYPEFGRDRKDDFLIAHSVVARADYLVTWDKDLLDLREVEGVFKEIEGVRIVTPPEFLHILRAEGLL